MKTLSREEYKSLLDAGWRFRGACLYEADHAPKGTEFVYVQLGRNHTTYLRVIHKPTKEERQ